MLIEPSSLSLVLHRIGETLRTDYGIDPAPVYEEVGVKPEQLLAAGERLPNRVVNSAFERAAGLSGDPAFALKVGMRSKPQNFFVIGHVWLASSTLAEAISKMLRYEDILNSENTDLGFERSGEVYVLSEAYPTARAYPGKLRADLGISSVLKMCYISAGRPVYPHKLEVLADANTDVEIYRPIVHGSVEINDQRNALYFSAEDLEAPLSGSIPDVVEAGCRIADRYLASLDNSKVANQVRAQLVRLLPSGSADQDRVASALYCSASTLQRQLSSEGTSYRDVLDATRRELAEVYLSEHRHSLSQTAFLVGFSDQSNFARAFKRWTGMSPGEFRKQSAGG